MIRKKKDDCKSYVNRNESSNFSPQTPPSRSENRRTGGAKHQSRRDSRNIKDKGLYHSGEKVCQLDQSQRADIRQLIILFLQLSHYYLQLQDLPRTGENRLHHIVINPLLTVTHGLLQHLHPAVIMGATIAVLQILHAEVLTTPLHQ